MNSTITKELEVQTHENITHRLYYSTNPQIEEQEVQSNEQYSLREESNPSNLIPLFFRKKTSMQFHCLTSQSIPLHLQWN